MAHLPKSRTLQIISLSLLSSSLFIAGCMDLASHESKNKKEVAQKIKYQKGQVYTMRGLGGIFSRGMNRLEDTLDDDYHIQTASTIWYKAKPLSEHIIANYKSKKLQGPIVLIGHSLGANEQIKVARYLEREHIPVALLMTIDAVSPQTIPSNVQEAFNIYKPGIVPMFSGLAVKAIDPEFTHVDNFNVVRSIQGVYVNHFTIDKNSQVQKIMLDKVLAALNTTAKKQIS